MRRSSTAGRCATAATFRAWIAERIALGRGADIGDAAARMRTSDIILAADGAWILRPTTHADELRTMDP